MAPQNTCNMYFIIKIINKKMTFVKAKKITQQSFPLGEGV